MLKWLKYSGCVISLRLNPFHWRLSGGYYKSGEWENDFFYVEILPIMIRVWFDDGSW